MTLEEIAVEGITQASGDLVALYAALTAAGLAVWVAYLIYAHFRVGSDDDIDPDDPDDPRNYWH